MTTISDDERYIIALQGFSDTRLARWTKVVETAGKYVILAVPRFNAEWQLVRLASGLVAGDLTVYDTLAEARQTVAVLNRLAETKTEEDKDAGRG